MLQDEQFEKTFRMSWNSFVVLHDMPFSVRLIASICAIHNFLIDARDTVPDVDILQAAAERNGGVVEDDVEKIGGAGEQN